MKLENLGFSEKMLGINFIFLLTMGTLQLLVMSITSKAISTARDQGQKIDRYNTVNLIGNRLAETRYWLNDVALTWDLGSIEKARTAKKSLDDLINPFKNEFPDEVTAVEKRVAILFNTTTDAVTAFATGDHEAGSKFVRSTRTINEEINVAVNRMVGINNESNTIDNPTEKIIDQIAVIGRLFWINLLILLLSCVLLWLFSDRSIIKPIRGSLIRFRDVSKANLDISQKLSQSSHKSSSGVSEQASAIQESVATLNEISSMVNRSVEIANVSAQKAEMSYQISSEGKAAVDQMRDSMSAIRSSIGAMIDQLKSSNGRISGTVSIIDKIAEKTNVINDIVFQTKLLSFNASVEAARAGENGRGFAVVAEEVGNLARLSGQAAREIGDLLRSSRDEVARIVSESESQSLNLMKSGVEKVEIGVRIADRCDEILMEVVENAGSVKKFMDEICAAAKEEAEGIHNIANAMNMLDTSTHMNSDLAAQTKSFASTLSRQSINLSDAVDNLSDLVFGRKAHAQIQTQDERVGASEAAQKPNGPASDEDLESGFKHSA